MCLRLDIGYPICLKFFTSLINSSIDKFEAGFLIRANTFYSLNERTTATKYKTTPQMPKNKPTKLYMNIF